ncbi:hypothetical protein [Pseudomonas sp. URMO17WK12:I11]|uniref:phage tail tube protein n=1 Tax=Pseudomonas sp. URMO17WK12:I11 TaxID=1283291 RepID=UPI0011A7F185|nr:hypothetical protein [Pseudomonas sp. URMO17WK12:I11]
MGSLFNPIDNTKGWIGNGAVLISKLDSLDRPVGGFSNAGMCSSAVLALSNERVEMRDTMTGSLGIAQSRITQNKAEGTVTIRSFEPKNLAMALYGDVIRDAAVAKTVTRTAHLGASVVIDGIATEITSVKSSDGLTTYENGVHFLASSGSIFIIADQPAEDGIADGDELEIAYQGAAVDRIEGFIKQSMDVQIVFEGMNVSTSEDVKVTWYKVSLDPAAQRQLVSTDYGDLELKGVLQISKAITGAGLSKMFKEEHRVTV